MSDESYRKWLRAQVIDALGNVEEVDNHYNDCENKADALIDRFFIVPRHNGVGK